MFKARYGRDFRVYTLGGMNVDLKHGVRSGDLGESSISRVRGSADRPALKTGSGAQLVQDPW